MNVLKKVSDTAPVVMLGITVMTAVMYHYDFYLDIYKYLPDTMGYSVLTNIVFLRMYWNKRFCNPTKASIIGLLAVNILSILTYGTEHYEPLYDIYVGGAVIITILTGIIRR